MAAEPPEKNSSANDLASRVKAALLVDCSAAAARSSPASSRPVHQPSQAAGGKKNWTLNDAVTDLERTYVRGCSETFD